MKAILLGSLSVLADTSELQRTAFNVAFLEAGLDWEWSREEYRTYLESSGGQKRIADYAQAQGDTVDAATLHARKSEIFQAALTSAKLDLRPVPHDMMEFAKMAGIKLAFVSSSSEGNVAGILQALNGVDRDDFALVTSAQDVAHSKPQPDVYRFALEQLGLEPEDVIAVEDNVPGVEAAQAAGITCYAYPNQNTASHDFGTALPAEDWQQRKAS